MKITSIDKNVKSVLSSNYYRIPRFQRPYSWTQENITDFWNDTIVDSDSDYFIGSIVVFDAGDDSFGIVDGQQRLSTITMVLCAIRNALHTEGHEDLAQAVHQLIERADINYKQRYVVSTETSFPYFQEYVQKYGVPDMHVTVGNEEKDISNAFKQVTDYITSVIKSIKDDPSINEETKKSLVQAKLISIRDTLLKLSVIFIQLDNEDDACTIFETLNTRGKDLNVSDLVKALLTRLLPTKNINVDTPKMRWLEVCATIEDSSAEIDVVGFLHHYWLSKYEFTTQKKLYKEIRKRIKKQNAQNFLNDLVRDSQIYRQIHETSYGKWSIEQSAVRDSLDAFSTFRIRMQVPTVLSVMREYRDGRLNLKEVREILASIENFHFVFTAVTSQRSSGGISQMYASSARALSNALDHKGKLLVLKDLHVKLRNKVPSYDEFSVDFRELKYSNKYTKQKKLVKYILARIHAYDNQGIAVDYDRMTVEHITPQDIASNSDIDYDHVCQLGNLILVPESINGKLGDKSFSDKVQILNGNNIYLDDKIKSVSSWSNQSIDERTEYLADVCYKKIFKA